MGKFERFFIFRYKRRPIRFFGPIGVLLFVLGSILSVAPVRSLIFSVLDVAEVLNLSPIFMTVGILVFCFGLFGELIAFANAKRMKDYTVETILNF